MTHSNPQFTPEQILGAGQRAEAEGRTEYAVQFFRHLADHYPHSNEAGIAREALARLGQGANGQRQGQRGSDGYVGGRAPEAGGGRHGEPLVPPFTHGGALNETNGGTAFGAEGSASFRDPSLHVSSDRAGRGLAGDGPPGNVHDPSQVSGHVADLNTGLDGGVAERSRRSMQIAPTGYDPGEGVFAEDLPEPLRGYWIGRTLAVLFSFAGVLIMIGGVGLMVLAWVPELMRVMAPVLSANSSAWVVVAVSVLVIVSGLALCLLGQLARAVFDNADAARYIARERAIGRGNRA